MSKKIIKLCEIIGRDLAKLHKGNTASALWPFIPNEAEYYIGDFWIKELYNTIFKLKLAGKTKEEISKLFEYPSKIAQYFTLFHSAKILELKKRKELAEDLIDYIEYFREDPFCENEKNKLKNVEIDTENLNSEKEMIFLSNKFSALLLLYLEILYPTMMRMGHEFHGPYEKNGRKYIIKEFYNLQPNSLNLKKTFPYNKVILIEEIEGYIEIDFFNHLFKSARKKAIKLKIDNKILSINELNEILRNTESFIKDIINKIEDYNRKDWFKVYARGIFNSISSLKKEIRESCIPPRELFDKIDKEDFSLPINKIVEFNKNHTIQEIENLTKNSFLKIFGLKDEK